MTEQKLHFHSYTNADAQPSKRILHDIWREDVGAISYYQPSENCDRVDSFHRTLIAEIVNEQSTQPAGFGNVSHYATHPTHALLNLNVHPDYQGKGIGKAIYQRLSTILAQYKPLPCLSATYEDQVEAISFLQRRGFQERMRTYLPSLDVARTDLTHLKGSSERIMSAGYQIYPMSELAQDPRRNQKLADLLFEIYNRIHPFNPPGKGMYERREEIFLSDLLPEATFIAVNRDEYAAVGGLVESLRPNTLDINTFGVSARHQAHHLDLALAIKQHEITFAKRQQIQQLVAEVDSTDELGMKVLAQLPFQHRSPWITFEKGL